MKKVIIIVLISLIAITGLWYFLKLGSQWPCDPPEKPNNVPEEAVWKGGCDGGNWIELISISSSKYRFRIYRDWDGTLELDADFEPVLCEKINLTESNWSQSITGYLNEKINIQDTSCYLNIVYPAYGGSQWEIIKEKQDYK